MGRSLPSQVWGCSRTPLRQRWNSKESCGKGNWSCIRSSTLTAHFNLLERAPNATQAKFSTFAGPCWQIARLDNAQNTGAHEVELLPPPYAFRGLSSTVPEPCMYSGTAMKRTTLRSQQDVSFVQDCSIETLRNKCRASDCVFEIMKN